MPSHSTTSQLLFVTRAGALSTGGGQCHAISARFHTQAIQHATWTDYAVPLPGGHGAWRKAQTYARLHKGHIAGVHDAVLEDFDRMLDRTAPRAVHFDTSLFGPLALLAKRRGCMVFTQCHNCEYDYFAGEAALRGGLSGELLRAAHRAESLAVEASDVLFTLSDYDLQRIALVYGRSENTVVVNPMLFDLRERLAPTPLSIRSTSRDSRPTAVFLGSAGHQNRLACKMLTRRWHGTRAQLTIVGKVGAWVSREIDADERQRRGISVAGFVESVDRVLATADTMVCPMHLGSGVKVKMIDALANECPVLASAEAMHGFEFAEASGYVRHCSHEEMESQTAQSRNWALSPERLRADLASRTDAQLTNLREAYVACGLTPA